MLNWVETPMPPSTTRRLAPPAAVLTPARLALLVLAVAPLLAAGVGAAPTSRPAVQASSRLTQGLTFAEVRLSTGIRMRYAVQGDPNGRPVVLLHGITDSWFSWSRVLPLFPAEWRVYALDQRGHGGTSRPDSGYSLPEMADDVIAFLESQGIDRAALVGHSMGSLVAQHVAARAPSRVSRLVIVGSGVTAANPVVAEVRQAVDAMSGSVPESFAREFQASTIHVPVPDDFFRQAVAISLGVPLRVWQAALAGFFAADARADLVRVSAPTLLLWGDRDAIFSRSDQDALMAGIAGSRLVPYPETGHAPHWERPERFARDLEAFLAAP